MEEYLGKPGKYITLIFNILALGGLGVVQIIACSSDIYLLSSDLNKRDWALIWCVPTFLLFELMPEWTSHWWVRRL